MVKIQWNWQQEDWPNFSYDTEQLTSFELDYIKGSGLSIGVMKHLSSRDQFEITIELLSTEALKSSEIEGEILDRESLQSSIRREFGLGGQKHQANPAETGIAEMMRDLYTTIHSPLDKESLCRWHDMLMNGRRNIVKGEYRTHKEAMQVVSGRYDKPTVHFEAPPSSSVAKEMDRFIQWFNHTAPGGKEPLSPLTRAGLTHLYFVSIHPFEDGNGRIGRALVEKALSQCMEEPTLIALSATINNNKKEYYTGLETNNKGNVVTPWLLYFAQTIIDAQKESIRQVEFIIKKAQFYDEHKNNLNPRQLKVVSRVFKEGIAGFSGGLSAKNYMSITKTTPSTATRDLSDLVNKGIFTKFGERKSTRYTLVF